MRESPAGQTIGDAIEAVASDRQSPEYDDPLHLAHRKRNLDDLMVSLLEHARLTERGRLILQGAQRLAPVLHFIAQNITNPITRDDLARVACLSPPRFSVVFRESLNESPMTYLRKNRLEKARIELALEGRTIRQVAERYCFSDAFHFSKAFKREFGKPPHLFKSLRVDGKLDSFQSPSPAYRKAGFFRL